MQNFQDTFETSKRSCISAFSIFMTVPLNSTLLKLAYYRLNLQQTGKKMLVVTKSQFTHSSKDEQKELIMNEDRLRCKIASGRIASYIKDQILGICWIGIHVRSYSSASASQTIPTRSRYLLTNTHISQFQWKLTRYGRF